MQRRKNRRGSNAIEFALTLPLVVALLTGIMDYGFYFSQQQVVVHAARTGARRAAISDPETENAAEVARDAVTQVLTGAGVSGAAKVGVVFSGAAPNATVTVDVKVDYAGLAGLVPIPGALGSTISSRLERQ